MNEKDARMRQEERKETEMISQKRRKGGYDVTEELHRGKKKEEDAASAAINLFLKFQRKNSVVHYTTN